MTSDTQGRPDADHDAGLPPTYPASTQRADTDGIAEPGLRELLRATSAIIGDLDIEIVLRRVVEVACRLVNARYGALGVVAGGGGLSEFITVGIDDAAKERIGSLPEGKGLLGALVDDPRPIRLRDIADDPRASGFPAGHPPMKSFLGVPIRMRGQVFRELVSD